MFSDFRFLSEALQHRDTAEEHPSIGQLQHCSMHPSSPCTLQPVCAAVVTVLWPDDTQHIYAEYKDPGITTANHSPSILVIARSSAAAVLRKLKRV